MELKRLDRFDALFRNPNSLRESGVFPRCCTRGYPGRALGYVLKTDAGSELLTAVSFESAEVDGKFSVEYALLIRMASFTGHGETLILDGSNDTQGSYRALFNIEHLRRDAGRCSVG
jgi:hypothetical protein